MLKSGDLCNSPSWYNTDVVINGNASYAQLKRPNYLELSLSNEMQLPEICALWGPYLSPWSYPMWWLILLHISRNCDQWLTCTSYSLNMCPYLFLTAGLRIRSALDPEPSGWERKHFGSDQSLTGSASGTLPLVYIGCRKGWTVCYWQSILQWILKSLAYRSFLPRTLQHNGWKNGNLYYKLFERNFIFNLLICF